MGDIAAANQDRIYNRKEKIQQNLERLNEMNEEYLSIYETIKATENKPQELKNLKDMFDEMCDGSEELLGPII